MATYFARKSGNINAADVWATTPSGTAAAVTFVAGDVLMANGFTVNVNVSVNLGVNGQIRNDTTGGATAGGGFTTTAATTLTANVFAGSSGTGCLSVGLNTNLSGNVTGGSGTFSVGVNLNGGFLTLTGNATAGTGAACSGISAFLNSGLIVTGNVIGGSGSGGQNEGIRSNTQNITVTGNITGGSGNGGNYGVRLLSGSINVTGIVAGGAVAVGINNESTGNITLVGTAMPSNGASGIINTSTGQVSATRITANGYGPGSVGVSNVFGIVVTSAQSSFVQLEQMEYGALGQPPVSGKIRFTDNPGNYIKVNTSPSTTKTLIDATQNAAMPAATDVRFGVSYASGALTGSAYIPAAGSTALGVPVDATVGSAVLTAAAIRTELAVELARIDAAVSSAGNAPTVAQIRSEMDSNSTKLANLDATVSSRLAPSGTLATVTTLTNAPTVPTAAAIATQVRTELATELARVDVATSTRLATSSYTAPSTAPTAAANASAVRTELATELARVDVATSTRLAGSAYTAPSNSDVTAIKAKTDLLETTRLAQCSTVATTGAQLAAALS